MKHLNELKERWEGTAPAGSEEQAVTVDTF
jgi:hypothetical protein